MDKDNKFIFKILGILVSVLFLLFLVGSYYKNGFKWKICDDYIGMEIKYAARPKTETIIQVASANGKVKDWFYSNVNPRDVAVGSELTKEMCSKYK